MRRKFDFCRAAMESYSKSGPWNASDYDAIRIWRTILARHGHLAAAGESAAAAQVTPAEVPSKLDTRK
jgi:hypothetical protein